MWNEMCSVLALAAVCVSLQGSRAAAQATFETNVAPEFANEDLSRHKGDPPVIRNVGFVAPNILCVEIREFKHIWGKLIPYEEQPGDEIKVTKTRKDGSAQERQLIRANGRKFRIAGPAGNLHVHENDRVTGLALDRSLAVKPDTWTLTGPSSKLIKPTLVHLKQKPNGPAGRQTRDHWYCLKLPSPLKPGAQYMVDVGQHGLSQSFVFDLTRIRSEALHVSHVGYRPDDPAKIGFLSYWSGTGGAVTYSKPGAFAVVDVETRKPVYRGVAKLRTSKDEKSFGVHAKGRNYALSDVWACDFSELDQPGEYVLCMDAIGCSYPFRIARDAWDVPTRVSLRGFFHHRAGQEWKEPWADWEQPRAFHPDNGEDYWELSKSQLDMQIMGGRHEDFMATGKFDEWKTGRKVANAWGGYYDAGDFDRHTAHLICSRNMLELIELFPDYYGSFGLQIPEARNDLPDLLDEALWAIDLYRRMQRDDGAVYGGIETNGHPNSGEPAFLDSLTRYVFAPDPRASWRYAASAARAAYVLEQLNQKTAAETYLQSAIEAMQWAETEYSSRSAYFEKYNKWWQTEDYRNLAAVALYRVTRDDAWRQIFENTCVFKESAAVNQDGKGNQQEAAFIYATMPDELTDPAIKANAVKGIEVLAREQIQYSDGVPFMWSAPEGNRWIPLLCSVNSTPHGQPLCRAYTLTRKKEYLEYAVRTTLNSVGANPQNMTFTTKLGHRYPEFPLQLNRYNMHQPEPYAGYTVYGLHDLPNPPWWVKQWFVTSKNSAPEMGRWPVAESYWDIEGWPMVNENTVHQSMAPAVYVWGYLAARP
jgi:endoglucanase